MADSVAASGGAEGTDAGTEAEVVEAIGIMFGMKIMMDKKEEDAELFPEEGTQ